MTCNVFNVSSIRYQSYQGWHQPCNVTMTSHEPPCWQTHISNLVVSIFSHSSSSAHASKMVLKWYDIPSHRSAAPWKTAFLDDVTSMEGQEFVFSSVRESQVRNDQFEGSCAFSPRARFCAFRSFWAELPNNPGNSAPRNETNFASEMPTYTTDVRTGKISELFPHSSQFGLNDYGSASGGGGPCEAVWWARASMRQWRVRGRAFVVGPDIESGNHGASMVREALLSRMHATKPGDKKSWSWKRELTAHFGNLSPGMRGMWMHRRV